MSSVQHPSEFLKEPQTAAAEEILSEFEETSEERKSHTTDLLAQNASENVVSADQQLCNQDRISTLKQENPDTLQIQEEQEKPEHLQIKQTKEEADEHYIVQEEDHLFLNQESDGFMVTFTNEESHKSEPNNDRLHPHDSDVRTIQSQSKEISEDIKKVIIWYSEDGNDCQHRLLDICMRPQPEWHRTDISLQHVCEEEISSDLQLCNQEQNASLDKKKPSPPQIQEEDDEHGTSGQREQVQLNQAIDSSLMMATYKGLNHSDPESTNDPFFSHSVHLSMNTDQEEKKNVDSKSNTNSTVVRPFACNSCGRKFSERRYLLYHETRHVFEESLHCNTCGEKMRCASQLARHMRTHTGEKPFSCEICGKCFSQSNHLKDHMRTHTGEKPYFCETCRKGFSRRYHLNVHMRTHTGEKPYSCETCGKCFSQICHLNVHMRTHTGEKPYSCKTCLKSFGQLSGLKFHMKIHTGEKPFFCRTCGRCFSELSALKFHRRIHSETPFTL
ncbi:uncharacterized protein KZ484_021486 [Pholidichthys leucotaenia]